MQMRYVGQTMAFGVTLFLGANLVSSQEYPSKPIRIVTGSPGSGSDFTARLVAQGLSNALNQSVIVENRAPLVAPEVVSKAPPDGYTVLVAGGTFLFAPLLQKVSYDVLRDFSPISLIERSVNILAVHPSLPTRSVKDLIVLAKARPGELNYASSSAGGPAHLASELFKSMAGISIVHIPYKGNSPAITALISGEVHMTIVDAGLLAPHVKSGKLRALAVTSAEPSTLVPGLPTVAASGLPGFTSIGMTGMFAPVKTAVPTINQLNQEILRFVNRADVKEKYLNAGVEVVGSSPQQFVATIKSEMTKWSNVIKDANIKPE